LIGATEDIGWRNRSAAVVDLDDLIGAVFAGFARIYAIHCRNHV
jgi:hypothetical protein